MTGGDKWQRWVVLQPLVIMAVSEIQLFQQSGIKQIRSESGRKKVTENKERDRKQRKEVKVWPDVNHPKPKKWVQSQQEKQSKHDDFKLTETIIIYDIN